MEIGAKERLAKSQDSSKEAAGVRLAAALKAIGIQPTDFARRSGQTPNAVYNSTNGWSYPSKRTMEALWRNHQIDPTFILFGHWGHLPVDVQDRIFAALADAASAPDRPGN